MSKTWKIEAKETKDPRGRKYRRQILQNQNYVFYSFIKITQQGSQKKLQSNYKKKKEIK